MKPKERHLFSDWANYCADLGSKPTKTGEIANKFYLNGLRIWKYEMWDRGLRNPKVILAGNTEIHVVQVAQPVGSWNSVSES